MFKLDPKELNSYSKIVEFIKVFKPDSKISTDKLARLKKRAIAIKPNQTPKDGT
jgi:hypothetical protein